MQPAKAALLVKSDLKESRSVEFARRLGGVFREAREAKGFSQNKLSELSGVGRTGIILFERGERLPSIHLCKALADALETRLCDLVRIAEDASEGG